MGKVKTPEQLAKDREDLIYEQANTMLSIISEYGNNPAILKQKLKTIKIKPDAIKIVNNYIAEEDNLNLPKESLEAIEDFYLSKTIIPPKTRPVAFKDIKDSGGTSGRLVTKTAKNADDLGETKKLKLQNTWMEKSTDKGEAVCEYIGTNLINQIMGKNSPKFRLYKDENGKIKLMSKYIPNFKTISELQGKNIPVKPEIAKSFANFFVASVIVGDPDIYGGNAGFRIDNNGISHWSRVDGGKALSYNIKRDFTKIGEKGFIRLDSPQTVKGFKQAMLDLNGIYRNSGLNSIYPETLFEGMNFACELNAEAEKIDTSKLRKVAKLSIQNLKLAYGDNFLDIPEVNHELKERMGFSTSDALTPETLENKIIENITRIKGELKEMAKIEFGKAVFNIPGAIDRNGMIDYKKVFAQLNPKPKDLSLFMEAAIENNDQKGIKFLKEQSKASLNFVDRFPVIGAAIEVGKDLHKLMMKAQGLDEPTMKPSINQRSLRNRAANIVGQ